MTRRFPIGAEVIDDGAHFRLWAPRRRRLEVVFDTGKSAELSPEEGGYFSGSVRNARAGARYRYRLDGGDSFPDPVSRFQPDGPHGSSQLVDPTGFAWSDDAWKGIVLEGQVIYEMHIGTFTREGTWEAARREVSELAEAGITVLEIMPVADFPGAFGWGYDGVGMYAPVAIYGTPDDFRRFVDEAHRHGVGVILDVDYNHVGPDGNYLAQFSDDYFTDRYQNEWGQAINFDGENCAPVREWVASNAAYWASEYHLDGLRLDATQQIFDESEENIQTTLTKAMRAAASGRGIIVVAENESQHTRLVRPQAAGGFGLDALWNDDFHHSAVVALTGRNDAYFTDYLGKPQEFISTVKYGYLYQGQRYKWQSKRRGTPSWGIPPARFINYIENHDQLANSGRGERLNRQTSPGRLRAITALLLLAPGTPMLFQGQEFGASTPFLFFADHGDQLRPLVYEGRVQFLSQFRNLAQVEMRACQPDPGDRSTFERCKLDFSEREKHAAWYQLHKDLLRLRGEDPVFRAQKPAAVDGSVLGDEALVLRYFNEEHGDRLLLVNLGRDLWLDPAPEPLLAPPEGRLWREIWSSEAPAYGGSGTAPLESADNWRIPGHAAVVMRPGEPNQQWLI
jgi:maltooligosyltrehalose trehalohydrolase